MCKPFLIIGGVIMQLKGIQAIHKGRVMNIELPDKKSIVLCGGIENRNYVIDLLRMMLGVDYSDNLPCVQYKSNDLLKDSASIRFTTGSIILSDGAVTIKGKVPYLHCVMLTEMGVSSFLVSQTLNHTSIGHDMTKFSNIIPVADWIRLVELFNRYAGFDCAILENTEGNNFTLTFSSEMTEELRLAYLLMSESFLTPKDYLRVVLLPQLSLFDAKKVFELVELADNITRLEMFICGADIDIKAGSIITPVNC